MRFLFLLVILLSGCGLQYPVSMANVSLTLRTGDTSDIMVKFRVDDEGRVTYYIPQIVVEGFALPGSTGARFNEYSIKYFDSGFVPMPTANDNEYRGLFSLVVPASKIECPGLGEDEECNLQVPGAKFVAGEKVLSSSFSPLDSDILARLLSSPGFYGYADIVLSGYDDQGRRLEKLLSKAKIIIRGEAE